MHPSIVVLKFFLELHLLEICAYNNFIEPIGTNQAYMISPFLALMFFLCVFWMINEKTMVDDNNVLFFLLPLM